MAIASDRLLDRAVAAVAEALGIKDNLVREVVRMWPKALAREQRRSDKEGRREMNEAKRATSGHRPTDEREARGDLVGAEVIQSGGDAQIRLAKGATVTTRLAQAPIDRMNARKEITARQFTAAGRLRNDYELGVLGARDKDAGGVAKVKLHFIEAQVHAAEVFARIKEAVGPTLFPILDAVVCQSEDLKTLAQRRNPEGEPVSTSSREFQQLRWQFSAALDRLGDAYKLPGELYEETIEVDWGTGTIRARIQYRHEASVRVSGVYYNGVAWLASAESVGALKEMARARLRGEA